MARCLTIFFITVCVASGLAQKLDSIRYQNGFLFYHEYGKGEAIILLTGGPGNNCSQLADMAAKLSAGNRVILLEERGTGLSIPDPLDSTTINLQIIASDINMVLDHLDLKEAIICGHSWGATLAMYFASFFPERVKSLILVAPSSLLMGKELAQTIQYNRNARLSKAEKKRLDILSQKLNSDTITSDEFKEYNYLFLLGFISDKEKIESIMPKIDVPRNRKTLQLIFKDAYKSKIDLRTSLVSFKKPVCIIDGRQDILNFVGYEFKILFPSYELYWIQNCGHFPMYEQPDEFYNILFNVLSRQR
jgi:pimeloyl-ACP methyl ester carboxylesterase